MIVIENLLLTKLIENNTFTNILIIEIIGC